MSFHWMRRALLVLALGAALLTAACGSGTIESQFHPARLVVFGTGISDLGQGGSRYTVNDGGLDIWTQQVAISYGLDVITAASGGLSFATGNVRVKNKPDAAGNSATPTITEQIDTFLARGPIEANDLLILEGGTSDIIAEMAKVTSGAQTPDQMVAAVQQAGRDFAGQVRRLVDSGASHVMVVGTYDLGRTPWATAISQQSLLSQASIKFNAELLVNMVDLGNKVLYVDAALLYNLAISVPANYGLSNSTDPVCTSVDPGPGIGIGAVEVNSALCTPTTVLANVDYNQYLFADRVYPSPAAQRKFGEYAYGRIHDRF
ncbi:MAG: SGNH/GDSL hydrolase family protein [Ramlibacter sp.]